MRVNNKSGFTLLEIIIVIIIVGVLASLALPKFFSTVEFSRGTEALAAIGTLRSSVNRCLATGALAADCQDPTALDVDVNQRRFTYGIVTTDQDDMTITATRTAVDGGTDGDTIVFDYNTDGSVTRTGTGAFKGIR